MKKLFNVLVLLGLAYFFINYKDKIFNIFNVSKTETTENIVLEKITELGNLELANYQFKDIIEQKLVLEMLPDPKALLIVYGEAIGCINLKAIQKEDIVLNKDTLLINLPDPELCSFKIDHSKSTVYDTEYAFGNEALLFEEAYKKAEQSLKVAAIEAGILEQTKKNADLVLKPLFENLSNKPVVLKYKMKANLPRLQ